jgi:hypothetical protein
MLNQTGEELSFVYGEFTPEASSFNELLSSASSQLQNFFLGSPGLESLEIIFGNGFDVSKFEEISQGVIGGEGIALPAIEIIPSQVLSNADAAFSQEQETIYLSDRLVGEFKVNPELATGVLLEEYGHYLDSLVNDTDAVGDEGRMFAALVQGQTLSDSELALLRSENDHAVIELNGESVAVELSQVGLTEHDGKLFQSRRGAGNIIETRYSNDGIGWSDWVSSGGKTSKGIATASFNGSLFQAIRGNTSTKLYMRSSSDGVNWSDWDLVPGGSSDTPALEVFNGKLYQAVKGSSTNKMYIRSTADGVSWSDWSQIPGATSDAIALESFNGRLYMAVKGSSTDKIYVKSTADGINWNDSVEVGGETSDALSLAAFNGKLYIGIKGGNSNRVFVKSSSDGVNWSSSIADDGPSIGTPTLEVFDNKLFQIREDPDGKVYSRYTANGTSWSDWADAQPVDGGGDTWIHYCNRTWSSFWHCKYQ